MGDDALVRRMRRLRGGGLLRESVADVTLSVRGMICPVFVGQMDRPIPVASMPGVSQWPVEQAADWIEHLCEGGLRQFLLFGVTPTEKKDAVGSYATDPACPVNRLLRRVRERGIEAVLYADLCFCEYTDHGACGVLKGGGGAGGRSGASLRSAPAWEVDNDATLVRLGETAVAQARSGADVVAPSGMMDGQVGAVRRALDEAGFEGTGILSYSVKYASHLYGPFREAGGSVSGCDRRTHQMDFRRGREWRGEVAADVSEGADMVMVKPATGYLDVVRGVREMCEVPVAAYHVSGEYAMLHAAAERGWLNLREAALEQMYGIRRAGADLIVTYFAPQMVEWLG